MDFHSGTGSPEGGVNPALQLQGYGVWFPGMHPTDAPTPVDVLALLLDGTAEGHPRALDASKHASLLLDVGAGYGLHTLAAAALGHWCVCMCMPRVVWCLSVTQLPSTTVSTHHHHTAW